MARLDCASNLHRMQPSAPLRSNASRLGGTLVLIDGAPSIRTVQALLALGVALLCALVALVALGRNTGVRAAGNQGTPSKPLTGISFSPYMDGQDPRFQPTISAAQIEARLQIVAPYVTGVRSFGMSHGLEQMPAIARSLELQVAAGAWLGRDAAANAVEIDNLIEAALAGNVDIAIVGSETLYRRDLTEAQLLAYMTQVRQAIPSSIPVTTADTIHELLAHPNVIAASDIVFVNIYPYWNGSRIATAVCSLAASYADVVAAAGGKPVRISETGWPSAGNIVGAAVPSPENAATYFMQFVSWAAEHDVSHYYFEAFDEAWKSAVEGPSGAHWGVWNAQGVVKPGMEPVLNGQTASVECDPGPVGGPGTPELRFTYVPPYGNLIDSLRGQALHVQPSAYRVVHYIFVPETGRWWIKPTTQAPLATLASDGRWSVDITTGGIDERATQIAAFLVPPNYAPPVNVQSVLPQTLYNDAVAHTVVSRSTHSISGQITSFQQVPVPDVLLTLSGAGTGEVSSMGDGKYSFARLEALGPFTVTPSLAGYVFTPPSRTIETAVGNVIMDFVATAGADLSLSAGVQPNPVAVGTTVTTRVVVANAALAAANGVTATIGLPSSFYVASIATTHGSCVEGSSVVCNIGELLHTANAVIDVTTYAVEAGTFHVNASVTGTEIETNTANNSASPNVTAVQRTVTADEVTPGSGSGAQQDFAFRYTASMGLADFGTMAMQFRTPGVTSPSGYCYVLYDRTANSLSMLTNGGWWATLPLGSGTLLNNQCAISLGSTHAAVSGNSLTVTLAVTFRPAYAGTKEVWSHVADPTASVVSGWQLRGTWTATASPPVVTANTATPSSGSGATQTFSLEYGDSLGWWDLTSAMVWFTPTLAATYTNSCVVLFTPGSNMLRLADDYGNFYNLSFFGSGAAQNSRCSIDLTNSSYTNSGTTRIFVIAVTFKPPFAGTKTIYMSATSNGGVSSGWQARGTWTVP